MIPYKQDYWNFGTFNPDGSQLVTAHAGVLTLRDGTTGVPLTTLGGTGRATQPDWSPDGKHLVYATDAPGTDYDWKILGGSIFVLDEAGGTWSAPRLLVQAQGDNNYYPSFSPDGEWVLFNRAASGYSYNNPAAEIWIVKADGSAPPFKLAAAHDGAGLTDSWPRWSPFVQPGGVGDALGGPLMWITVSSKRAYGVELGANMHAQLWMFGFAPARQAAGMDPSFPAFWLPFQNIATANHIGQWTTRLVSVGMRGEPPPSSERE
jgi:WD40 repeat protein